LLGFGYKIKTTGFVGCAYKWQQNSYTGQQHRRLVAGTRPATTLPPRMHTSADFIGSAATSPVPPIIRMEFRQSSEWNSANHPNKNPPIIRIKIRQSSELWK